MMIETTRIEKIMTQILIKAMKRIPKTVTRRINLMALLPAVMTKGVMRSAEPATVRREGMQRNAQG